MFTQHPNVFRIWFIHNPAQPTMQTPILVCYACSSLCSLELLASSRDVSWLQRSLSLQNRGCFIPHPQIILIYSLCQHNLHLRTFYQTSLGSLWSRRTYNLFHSDSSIDSPTPKIDTWTQCSPLRYKISSLLYTVRNVQTPVAFLLVISWKRAKTCISENVEFILNYVIMQKVCFERWNTSCWEKNV